MYDTITYLIKKHKLLLKVQSLKDEYHTHLILLNEGIKPLLKQLDDYAELDLNIKEVHKYLVKSDEEFLFIDSLVKMLTYVQNPTEENIKIVIMDIDARLNSIDNELENEIIENELYLVRKNTVLDAIVSYRTLFNDFLDNLTIFGNLFNELSICAQELDVVNDFINSVINNKDVEIVTRLLISLKFVKKPNYENANILKENIKNYSVNGKEEIINNLKKRKVVEVCKINSDHEWIQMSDWFKDYKAEFGCKKCGLKKNLTKREYKEMTKQ